MSQYTPEQIAYLKQKIAAHVVEEGDCHVWTLCMHGAAPVVNTPRAIGRVSVRVRKFLFEYVWNKKKPGHTTNAKWLPVARCGNPRCLNEEHQAWATASTVGKMNVERTGYHLNPVRNAKISKAINRRKLSADATAEIRASDVPIKQLAMHHGVAFESIRRIKQGITYKDYGSPWAGLMR